MELSENTLTTLKNFSGINPNMMIRSGNTIKQFLKHVRFLLELM